METLQDQKLSMCLDWDMRFKIILGIDRWVLGETLWTLWSKDLTKTHLMTPRTNISPC
jgi:hypothetical protein